MYKVLRYFTDLQDDNHAYSEGDAFPRNGLTVSEERIKELSGKENKQGIALIEKVAEAAKQAPKPEEEKQPEQKKRLTKSDVMKMNKEDLVNLATKLGIVDASKRTVSELKELIIAKG